MEKEEENKDWVKWLSENLEFPFQVERVDDADEYVLYGKSTEGEPFRLGHMFKVISIDSFDDFYGIIVKSKESRHIGYVPLIELELTDKNHKNNQIIDEFLDWYSESHG
jgi:hypothetical protein